MTNGMKTTNKDILISGAGIAGITVAYWLKKYGFNPVIVEQSNKLRTGGYMIDFWGVGFDIAERMNLIERLRQKHYEIPEIEFVNHSGKRVGGFSFNKIRKLIHYRHFNMLRGELAKVLHETIEKDVEFIFGNPIIAMEENENGVDVTFSDKSSRSFDLVIGADGLHSNVRKLIFGDEEQFKRHLGYYVSSYTIENYISKPHIFQSYTSKGKWTGIYSIADNKLATFFIYKSNKIDYPHHDNKKQQSILQKEFKDVGWECPNLLKKMSDADDFYFDEASQIIMPEWSKGRIVLIGDAAYCVSPIAGKGAALAMAGAYVLAGEMSLTENYSDAFKNYEDIMRLEVERTQKMGQEFAPSFVPNTRLGIWMRNIFTKLMFIPFFSKMFIKKFLSEKLIPKTY